MGTVYRRCSGESRVKVLIRINTIKAIGRGIYVIRNKLRLIKSNTIDSTYYQGIYLRQSKWSY